MLNAVLGFVQEAGAERAVLALSEAVERTSAVIREGRERIVPSEHVVPGDLIVLREGDRVPADARVAEAERLGIDESALTGESVPVSKDGSAVAWTAPLAERSSMLYAGSAVTRGRARGIVVATGGEAGDPPHLGPPPDRPRGVHRSPRRRRTRDSRVALAARLSDSARRA